MSDCIFCKIAKGEIPGHILYEDNNVLAFLDISQTTKGHTLLIPKQHATDVFDTSPTHMAAIFSVVPQIANALKRTFGCEGLNIVSNNGTIAGQTVFHYHVHLIPRYSASDTFEIKFFNHMTDYPAEKLAELKDAILVNLKENQ